MPYEVHPRLTTPPDDEVLWRYLDFAKFLDLLERRVLWFTRADKFEDPLEGGLTDGETRKLRSLPPPPCPYEYMSTEQSFRSGVQQFLSGTFVNCWCERTHESMAMWDRYRTGGSVIALKSTVALLKEAIASFAKPVYIGRVKYIDWNDESWPNNLFAMCVRKELAYQHENEVRAIFYDLDQTTGVSPQSFGLGVPCELQKLMHEVVVGPREKPWVHALVESVMKRYELPQPVIASTLLQPRP
jgi:hypothetical protein